MYIGHAVHSGTAGRAESDSNKGTIADGFTVTRALYGGSAVAEAYGDADTAAEAKENVLVLKAGSAIEGTDNYSLEIYGGYAESRAQTGVADALGNKVEFEAGSRIKTVNDYVTNVYGGMAYVKDAKQSSACTALNNTVAINDGAVLERRISVCAGYALSEQGSEDPASSMPQAIL